MEETIKIPENVKRSNTSALPLAGVGHIARSEVFCINCVEGLRLFPDNYFDLAVVDPPYGYSKSQLIPGNKVSTTGVKRSAYQHDISWSPKLPGEDYFLELKRVSRNQIIWGANFFNNLPGGRLIWKKNNPVMSNCEIAYHSFGVGVYFFEYTWSGFCQGGKKETRIHPTQKPVALYDWIFSKYATHGQKILDTHLGSGSSRIAANKAGLNFVGFELDPEYFEAQEKRWKEFVAQPRLL